eukprot:3628899-Pleurochrysis_carterae.AAC.1
MSSRIAVHKPHSAGVPARDGPVVGFVCTVLTIRGYEAPSWRAECSSRTRVYELTCGSSRNTNGRRAVRCAGSLVAGRERAHLAWAESLKALEAAGRQRAARQVRALARPCACARQLAAPVSEPRRRLSRVEEPGAERGGHADTADGRRGAKRQVGAVLEAGGRKVAVAWVGLHERELEQHPLAPLAQVGRVCDRERTLDVEAAVGELGPIEEVLADKERRRDGRQRKVRVGARGHVRARLARAPLAVPRLPLPRET